MANTSSEQLASAMRDLLAFANSSASVNLYMAHGGTNFGFWAGAPLGGGGGARCWVLLLCCCAQLVVYHSLP
jgi:hypothetical protein